MANNDTFSFSALMDRKAIFLTILAGLAVTVMGYLAAESFQARNIQKSNEKNLQQLVHGLGLGATTKPTWCYINFDPRIDPRCPCIEWPIPGGYCYCPDHTGTISYIAGNVEMGVAIDIIKNQ
ncbi:MAG TPA: hypothetical protein ACFYDZ_07480 [Candidatus Brocadiaceae bacterium]